MIRVPPPREPTHPGEMLLEEFLCRHAEEKLAPKTIERYRELMKAAEGDVALEDTLLAGALVDAVGRVSGKASLFRAVSNEGLDAAR